MNVLNQAAAGVGMFPNQGTILPGTTIQLGKYTVVIDRYIAEGGFAHVYIASLANIAGAPPVVVKRIAAPDKERLAIVNAEIETMKRLGKHKNIVEYMDSCMGKLEGGGYEVLILMEFCSGGPVIDLMNRRLQHRLTEPEILKIFSNVGEAVAYMHFMDPPILHRDIKVENILLSNNDYKLCDFGSASTNILRGDNIPRNVKDIQMLEEEINNHTTLQYRAPEMVDLYMRKGIDEKIDIWALGVLLYKLCYYTTPFEEQGQLAILNARYTIPDYPVFSPGLIGLIRKCLKKSMLKEDPKQRPNIYQLMKATSALRGLPCPVQNIYPETSFPSSTMDSQSSATNNILSNNATMSRPMDVLPTIEPMRRGRPTRSPAVHTPSNQSDANAFPPQTDFTSAFDDSFGQFSSQKVDPSSQFSQIGVNDAFDFGSSSSAFAGDKPAQANQSRFALDSEVGTGTDEFGFKFSNGVDSVEKAASSSGGPRPPSFTAPSNPLPTVSQQSSSRVPAQPSGGPHPSSMSPMASKTTTSSSKPTANDLFFNSSSDVRFNNDFGSRSGTPSSIASSTQALIGLSSPTSTLDLQLSGMSKPLLGARQSSQNSQTASPSLRPNNNYPNNVVAGGYQGHKATTSHVSSRNTLTNYTGNSGSGLSGVTSPAPSSSISGVKTTTVEPLAGKMASIDLLQRQQIEQLGKFTSVSMTGPQNTQGKAKVLDPSKTLDGMRMFDSNNKTGLGSLPTSPPTFQRPTAVSTNVSGYSSTTTASTSLSRHELAKRDLEAEMKLIELQQKEFERQQQELARLQQQQLEEQQRQHRLQQEQLQKAQQEQIQRQHEKWQERKRMLQEKEQLAELQAMQHKDLVRAHQSQQLEQQQQQQRQSITISQNGIIPRVSDLTSSVASVSLNASSSSPSTSSSSNTYRRSISGTGVQTGVVYPSQSTVTSSSTLSSSTASTATLDGRTSVDEPTAPSVPVKSARRNGAVANGASSPSTTAQAALAKSRRASVNSNASLGPKPELLPKPTRFRMKDGTGNVMAGEEEAFRRKFPSTLDDDILLGHSSSTLPSSSSSSSSSLQNHDVLKKESTESFAGRFNSEKSLGETPTVRPNQLQYRSPSQRARDLRADVPSSSDYKSLNIGNSNSSSGISGISAARSSFERYESKGGAKAEVEQVEDDDDDEEEEEKLVRNRPAARQQVVNKQQSQPAVAAPSTSTSRASLEGGVGEEDTDRPMESVRERVQRMNRVGRVA
ncbi:hypothetical protein BGZ94_009873 [Podila epigama]|nr:hypothetical protein BGZ94_009873 [Podila epigama]